MTTGPLNGKAMAIVTIGMVFVWSGIKGWSLLGTMGDLITGKKPTEIPATPLFTVGASTIGPGASTQSASANDAIGADLNGGNGVAAVALQYQGHKYVFGNAPGRDGSQPWDCSSFVNWIVGVKLGRSIPGYGPGKYDGTSHGPPTGAWGVWPGLKHISRADVSTNDIVVWVGHMGIAVDNQHLMAARNVHDGTGVTLIDHSGNGPILCYGRFI